MKKYVFINLVTKTLDAKDEKQAGDKIFNGDFKMTDSNIFFTQDTEFWENLTIEKILEMKSKLDKCPEEGKIDINDSTWYVNDKKTTRTKMRLQQLNMLGCEEVGTAQFGLKGVFSGLYIESVWNLREDKWNEYIEWAVGLIEKKKKQND